VRAVRTSIVRDGGRRVDDAADDDLNWFRDRWVKDFC
jgi:hypothetical protein